MPIMTLKPMVDTFIVEDGRVLLGMKNRGIGKGFWNGFGGKVEDGESIVEAAVREVQEESGLIVSDIHECARFLFTGEIPEIIEAHMFIARSFEGEISPSSEMNPIEWHSIDSLPFDLMWPDFRVWIHHVLEGSYAHGHAHYDGQSMTTHSIEACNKLPEIIDLTPFAAPYAVTTTDIIKH